jgi:mRNA interferase MazF
MPEQKDIVLVPVPFTDLKSTRKRPAIVVSNDDYNTATDDMVVVAMTSNPTDIPYSFVIQQSDLVSGRLNRPGKVRVDKIFTLSQNIAVKVFGKVNEAVLDTIREKLGDLVISN